MRMIRNCTVMLMLLLSCGAEARTWYVEKDGSGDYPVIQDAVYAAATGDTVRIGAGRYTEHFSYSLGKGAEKFDTEVYVAVEVDSLTLIGEDVETTIIGPEEYWSAPNGPIGICTLRDYPVTRIENITVDNLEFGMYFWDGHREVSGCNAIACGIGIVSFADQGMLIEGCHFEHNQNNGLITHSPAQDVIIRECHFENVASNVSFNATPNANVYDCIFRGGTTGVKHQQGSSGGVNNCRFDGVKNVALAVNTGSSVTIVGNRVFGGAGNLDVHTTAQVLANSNIFAGGSYATTMLTNSTVEMHNNHILNVGGRSVLVEGHFEWPIDEYDLTNNYWGTAESDSIDAWIYDHNDVLFDERPFAVINYEPFSTTPLPTQQQTQGGLRRMFR